MSSEQVRETVSVQEAARLLQVSRPTVYRLIETGRLPAAIHPITGRRQIPRRAILALLEGSADPAPGSKGVQGRRASEAQPAGAPSSHAEKLRNREGREDTRDEPPYCVDSIFRAPELALDFGIPDLSDRIEHYRFGDLAQDEENLSRHVGSDCDEHADRSESPAGSQ